LAKRITLLFTKDHTVMVFENLHTVSRDGARDRPEVQPKVLDRERVLYCTLQGKPILSMAQHPLLVSINGFW
jgi:hypothetical protein